MYTREIRLANARKKKELREIGYPVINRWKRNKCLAISISSSNVFRYSGGSSAATKPFSGSLVFSIAAIARNLNQRYLTNDSWTASECRGGSVSSPRRCREEAGVDKFLARRSLCAL